MTAKQKGLLNITIIIGVIIAVGIASYFVLTERAYSPFPASPSNPTTSTPATSAQIPETNSGESTAYKDVQYFFDNINSFNEDLSRLGISESVSIRGKLIEVESQVQCIKAPCYPVKKHFALQDINNESYKIVIYQVNPLAQNLETGRTYILKGILKKDVDFGKKMVYISNFEPEEVIKIIQ